MNYPNISKNSSEIGHLLPNFLLMELNDYSEEENTSKNYTNTADVKPQKKKTNNKKKKNYDSNKKDLHYKSNINLSKNYSNSSYNKSYYINNEVQNKPSFKVKDQSYNYENSFYLGSTAKSSDSESCKARKDYFKRSSGENNTETDYDTIEDFIETHGVHLANYICTQKGSRNMQKYLNQLTPSNINLIINKIGVKTSSLMTNIYGNYFCQKLIQCCSAEQRVMILINIAADIVNISYDASGTHALQSLFELINLREEENIILNSIEKNCLSMCYDNNASHVVQKILVCISEERRLKINKIILTNIKSLALDTNGICVLKQFINNNKNIVIRIEILNELVNNTLEIVQSPFGNYAIQYAIQEWGANFCRNIIIVIINNIVSLSMQKYSSNVVEKVLELVDTVYI